MNRKIAVWVTMLAALGALGACAGTDDHQVVEPIVVGMTNELAPTYDDGETRIYQVAVPVRLPIRRPAESGAPGRPFLISSDVQVEIRFTISNLDDQRRTVELLIDPWNEFVRYRPGIQSINEEEAVPDFSGFDKFFVVPGKSRIAGVITPDDCSELAIDLATAQAIVAAPPEGSNINGMINRLFNLQNRSNVHDPLISPHIPKVIPGLIGFDLGLRSYESGNLAVEIIVDVVDQNGDRVAPPGDTNYIDIPAEELVPPKISN